MNPAPSELQRSALSVERSAFPAQRASADPYLSQSYVDRIDDAASIERSEFPAAAAGLFEMLGAVLVCVWLLLSVCLGATDLREELHALGLD